MLSYMLPTEDKPPPGEQTQNFRTNKSQRSPKKIVECRMVVSKIEEQKQGQEQRVPQPEQEQQLQMINRQIESPKHNGSIGRKSTLQSISKVAKDESLYSIDSEASSTVGSEKKNKILNGAKHAGLKRVSFGSSKGSMVETLVYETPVQEEPEINNFLDQNGRLPSVTNVPDTDEGREKVRVSLLGPQPSPSTPGVLLLEPIEMSNPPELLTTQQTEHTAPAYHAQISTDSGWDNPFRPDGDLSREADEIVELIKGGKPITPTPGQTSPPLPGCDDTCNASNAKEIDSSTSPLLKTNSCHVNSSPRNQENGNAHGTPMKPTGVGTQQTNDKVVGSSKTATVEVSRITAQGPGDASQVEHVTLKKKPKCKCCVLQ